MIGGVIAGIVAGWKNDWDSNGIESAKELKDLLSDESASLWQKILGVGKYAIKAIFGSIVSALKGLWEGLKEKWGELVEIWNDPDSSTWSKIWDSVKTTMLGIPEIIWGAVGKLFSTLGDYIFGFFGEDTLEWWGNFKEKISEAFHYIFDTIGEAFSWENIKEQWEEFKANPLQWVKNAFTAIGDFFNNIFSKIGQAITGDNEFDFGEWIKEKIDNVVTSIKDFFVGIFDKAKNAITNWWYDSKINPSNWFGGRQTQNVLDENGNILVDANGNPVTEEKTFWGRAWDWLTGKNQNTTQVDDAIISKDNDLYVPSPDDNILVTKSNVVAQPFASDVSDTFRQELMTVLRDIANNLKQPVVMNNLTTSAAVDFGGLRL